MYSKRTHF